MAGADDLAARLAAVEERLNAKDEEVVVLRGAVAHLTHRLTTAEEQLQQLKSAPTASKQPGSSSRPATGTGSVRRTPTQPATSPATATPARSGGSTGAARPSTGSASAGKSRHVRESKTDEPARLPSQRSAGSLERGKSITNKEDRSVKIYLRGRPVTLLAPSDYDMSSIEQPAKAPAEKLVLDWVYGYRGRDCRQNIFYLPSGEIMYFIAAVAVIYHRELKTQRHYREHNDDIKAMALHPDKTIVATGQVAGHDKDEGKPHVRVWNVETLTTLHVIGLGAFDRGFSALGFSRENDGAYLLAVDESNDHTLSVWDWAKKKKFTETKAHGEPVLGAAFSPFDNNAIVTYGKQHVLFWTFDAASGSLKKKAGVFEKHAKPKYITCATFMENGNLVTGDSNGNLFIWDGNKIAHEVKNAHENGVFSLLTLPDGTILSGGGKDHKITAWSKDLEDSGVTVELPQSAAGSRMIAAGPPGEDVNSTVLFVGTTRNTILEGSIAAGFKDLIKGHSDELWGLAVHPEENIFVTACYDKTVSYWEANTHNIIWTVNVLDEAQSADIHPSGGVVAVGLKTGKWLVFSAADGKQIAHGADGNEQHDCVRFSPDGKMLALGSHDNFLYIYRVSEDLQTYERLGRCSGHSSFITHFDWSADSHYLRSCSGDYDLLFWDATTGKQVTSPAIHRDTDWATFTTVLGFPVAGIWPEGADGTDINAVCRDHGGKLLATGDDFGKVNLFRYPVPQAKSECNINSGHSSHVTCVRFLHSDTILLSTGGKDTSIMQWRVHA